MPRLFVAVDLPEPHKARVAALKTPLAGARWVPPDQIHLTLRFLGEVDEEGIASLKQALEEIRFDPFPLALLGVGHFPQGHHPRVLWAGVEPSSPLDDLYGALERALEGAGFPPEERRFSPHITLARLHGTPAGAVELFENDNRAFALVPFPVERFVLYASILSRAGAQHQPQGYYPPIPPSAG